MYVDLTDWLPLDVTLRLASGPPDLDGPLMPIARRIDQLRREIFDDQADWDLDDLSQMHLTRYIAPLWFWHSARDLRYHRARWLAELLDKGARNIGYQDLGAHEIGFRAPAG